MPALDLVPIPGLADPFSSISHLFGAVVFAVLAVPLVRKGVRHKRAVPLVVFAASAVLLLAMSGVYHLLEREGVAREMLRRLDHAAIFVLIAGTFTPVHAFLFRGVWRWGMLAFIWTVALLGVCFKNVYFAATPEDLGLIIYLAMGWVGLFSMVAIAWRYGVRAALPLAFGGVAYTAGAAVEWFEPTPILPGVIRAHEVFHIAVLLGLSLHWLFIWSITGMNLPQRRSDDDPSADHHAADSPALGTGASDSDIVVCARTPRRPAIRM